MLRVLDLPKTGLVTERELEVGEGVVDVATGEDLVPVDELFLGVHVEVQHQDPEGDDEEGIYDDRVSSSVFLQGLGRGLVTRVCSGEGGCEQGDYSWGVE